MKKIVIAAGGTGGHFFPAVAVGEELKKRGLNVSLITDLRCRKYLTDDMNLTAYVVDLYISKQNIFKIIKSGLLLISATIKAFKLLCKIKPELIIGFGGYPSFSPMAAAVLLGIPIVIHEQNSFIGKSNRFFAKFAKKIALSYKETANIDNKFLSKVIYTGDIIRDNIKSLKTKSKFANDQFRMFVFGGSQSAQIFSILIPETIKLLKEKHPEISIKVTQQALKSDQEALAKIYNVLDIDYEISEFFYQIDKIYANSDLVIARAGASTIAELTYIGLPAIFIPYPFASENHQLHNAQALEAAGASWCFPQNHVTPQILADKIIELVMDRKKLQIASKNLLTRRTDGTKILADTVEKIIN